MEDSFFINRRTVRKYSDKPVDIQTIREIVSEASHAPTTGNMQLYSVVATVDKDIKRRLAPTHFNQPQVENCAVVLTVCADFNRFVKWCEQRKAVPGYDNLQSLVTACMDASIFAQQLVTTAESRGLGTCYLGTTTYNPSDIATILKLPKRVIPLTTITLGWPAETPEDCGRLPVDAILHLDTYHDYGTDDIDDYYREKELREDSKKFVSENNKQTLAQVFTDIRYPKANNEFFSKTLLEYIKQTYPLEGFGL